MEIPIPQTNPPSGIRRREPLRSRTVDTLLHILSICYTDSSHIIQDSDKGDTDIQSVTKDDTPLASKDYIPNASLCQKETYVVETRVVSGTQEESLYDKHVESPECSHKRLVESNDLSHKSDTDPSYSLSISSNGDHQSALTTPFSVTDLIVSTPHITPDAEEGEIAGELMGGMNEEDASSLDNTRPELENNLGKDMAVVVSKTRRNLVDYSEIAVHGRVETRKSECVPLRSILKNSATKNQDLASPVKDTGAQNNKKRQGSPTEEKRTNKKVKKSVGEHPEGVLQEAVDDSANKSDDANEKKKKRVLTKERKAKKKLKERIKRAEKNRKLGVKRLKLETVIKEKKIKYCRHYMNGRCQEGENCKFSHDTIPLTKSKPCCHFARHSCMKGDDCPFDHQLSKYPCNNYLSKGFCSRGSDCMFSHEAQQSETSLNAPKEANAEHKAPSVQDNLGSKKRNNIDGSSCEKVDTKSCFTPVSSISKPERNFVGMTRKLSSQPPKGISFLSQEKLPLVSEIKAVVQDSSEMTKTPPSVPRGINFLSFGKRPGSDLSNSGFSLKIRSGIGIGKSPLSSVEGGGVKVDQNTLRNDHKKANSDLSTDRPSPSQMPMPVVPSMSSSLQKAFRSTLEFAAKVEAGVKTIRPGNSPQKL